MCTHYFRIIKVYKFYKIIKKSKYFSRTTLTVDQVTVAPDSGFLDQPTNLDNQHSHCDHIGAASTSNLPTEVQPVEIQAVQPDPNAKPVTCRLMEQEETIKISSLENESGNSQPLDPAVINLPDKTKHSEISPKNNNPRIKELVTGQKSMQRAVQDFLVPYPAVDGRPVTALSQFSVNQVNISS